jgi:hypothetical protein
VFNTCSDTDEDDDGIETALAVRISSSTILAASENEPSPDSNHVPDSMDETEDAATHGFTDDGHPGSCAQVTDDSVITCAACLNREWQEASRELSEPTKVVCQKVLEVIRQAGDEGISKTSLSVSCGPPSYPDHEHDSTIHRHVWAWH